MMKNVLFPVYLLAALALAACQKNIENNYVTGAVKITIKNTVKGNPLILNTETYTNSHGEQYTVSKFKYYLSNVSVNGTPLVHNGNYYLIDESDPASLSFSFETQVGQYHAVSIFFGVDSVRNVSGAQTGVLDPLNDMFWTWNSGYIMAKMEGNSPQSPVVNNKVEYHIGGFSGVNNVTKNIGLIYNGVPTKTIDVREGKLSEIFIEADLDKWWQGNFELKIADNPAVTHPGTLAKSISDNYTGMFTIVDIKNY